MFLKPKLDNFFFQYDYIGAPFHNKYIGNGGLSFRKKNVMVNINQSEDKSEELKLSPLGTDEINSVIKSFKNSTFNQEELYKKDEKNFVKKTLFELAKESERISSEESQSKTDNSSEDDSVVIPSGTTISLRSL